MLKLPERYSFALGEMNRAADTVKDFKPINWPCSPQNIVREVVELCASIGIKSEDGLNAAAQFRVAIDTLQKDACPMNPYLLCAMSRVRNLLNKLAEATLLPYGEGSSRATKAQIAEQRRNGVGQKEIAQTLRDLGSFLEDRCVGEEHNRWGKFLSDKYGIAYLIETADQKSFNYMFGHGDVWHYWPGRLIPTLKILARTVEIYAEHGSESEQKVKTVAKDILDRLKAFKATTGGTHLSTTDLHYEYVKTCRDFGISPNSTVPELE